jgi:type I restriction enzyme R subunit
MPTVYTSLDDLVSHVEAAPELYESHSFDKEAYKRKLEQFVRENQYDLIIDKIRKNQSISLLDLEYIEQLLFDNGRQGSKEIFKEVYGDKPLGEFIRTVVGLDKIQAKNEFSKLVNFASLNALQVQFMDLIIEYFSVNGIMDLKQLFNAPFSNVYAGGIVNLFDQTTAMKIAEKIKEINRNCLVA